MKKFATVLILTGLVMLAVGCGSDYQNSQETFLKQGICQASAPAWVASTTPLNVEDSEYLYFVGRGIGYNTLDERSAYNHARDHAIEQIAYHIGTHVSAGVVESDMRNPVMASGILGICPTKGNRFLPGEKSQQELSKISRLATNAVAGDIEDMGTYWEQYQIEEVPSRFFNKSRVATRYKCWVLFGVPKASIAGRIADVQQKLDSLADARANSCCSGASVFSVTSSHGRAAN